jgi:hypothetical protein
VVGFIGFAEITSFCSVPVVRVIDVLTGMEYEAYHFSTKGIYLFYS